jgi:carboxypeptidase T
MRFSLLLLFSILSLFGHSQASKLKVWLDPISESLMREHGLEMDHGQLKRGVFLINDFSPEERAWMKEAGVKFDVLVDDVTTFYVERSAIQLEERGSRSDCLDSGKESFPTPTNFGLGSMGGFYTYQEYLDILDLMATSYPNLITVKTEIDTFRTHEDRPIYWVKISDNPTVNEAEPEVLYTSIHHAREPQSLTQLIFYMWYLLENYGTNDEATYLVKNTEMYFIPMINPDGYVQNQTTNPNGGGFWRKNRRDNLDGETGVDLNRNYGYEWGYDDEGSSPQTNSETYRGPSAFSEPETRAVKWFSEQHEFLLALNYHAFGNYLIYPWGFIPSPLSPDSNYFISIAQLMTAQNNYVYGTGYETVAYATNGVSDDWMYGEQTAKNKIFSMTPEVGNSGDGFWPAQSRIVPLSEENVRPNLLLSHFANIYVTMTDRSPATLSALQGSLEVEIERLGLEFDASNSYTLEPVSANITSASDSKTYSSMNIASPFLENFNYELDPNIQTGEEVVFNLVSAHTGYSDSKQITKIYGQSTVAISNKADDLGDFNSSSWGTTTDDFISPPTSITESPSGFYSNSLFSELEYNRIIDMRQSITGYMTFQAKWQIEAGYDYCQMLASPVGENNWTALCGLYTKEGTQNQSSGQPLWDGNQNSWVTERVSLDDFIGERIKLKFRFVSDQFVNYDGFFFDDFEFVTLLDASSSIGLDTGYVDTINAISEPKEMAINWTMYPNPAQNELRLVSKHQEPTVVSIHNMDGQLIRQLTLSSSTSIDLSSVPSSAYLVSFESKNSLQRERLLIVR